MLSKKTEKEINLIAADVFSDVLKKHNPYKEKVGVSFKNIHRQWYDDPPDIWTEGEKEFFDTLSDFQNQLTSRVIELLKSKNGK